jgi:hypothetical protein
MCRSPKVARNKRANLEHTLKCEVDLGPFACAQELRRRAAIGGDF